MSYNMIEKKTFVSFILFVIFLSSLPLGDRNIIEEMEETSPSPPFVIMTFDDALSTWIDEALPRMSVYGWKGVAFAPTTWYTAADFQKVADAGWEIGSHTLTHPLLTQLSESEIEHEVADSKAWLEANIDGANPVISFAYPSGNDNELVRTVVSRHYKYACDAGWYKISSSPWDLTPSLTIPRYIICEEVYKERMQNALDDAITTENSVVLLFHDIRENPGTFGVTPEHFQECLEMIAQTELQVLTFKDINGLKIASPYFSFVPNPTTPGTLATLRGVLVNESSNPISYASVNVEYSTNNGAIWKNIWTLTTSEYGIFSRTFWTPGTGGYLVRVRYVDSSTYMPSSNNAYFGVLSTTYGEEAADATFFNFFPNPASPRTSVTLRGILLDEPGQPIVSVAVNVEYSTNHGATWNSIWTLTTNTYGIFSKSFTAPAIGTYLVRVSYGGSSITTYLRVLA